LTDEDERGPKNPVPTLLTKIDKSSIDSSLDLKEAQESEIIVFVLKSKIMTSATFPPSLSISSLTVSSF
jgi:hypothetical protein